MPNPDALPVARPGEGKPGRLTAAGDAMRRFGSAALLACFAALLALSCASERALNVGDAARETERALSVGDTVQKEIRVNGETIAALMSVYEIAEYDSLGNLIHRTNRHAESWHEYDAAGREIHSEETHPNAYLEGETSPISIELVHEYDANGRKIRSKSNHGSEIQYEYDADGRLVHSMETPASTGGEENWYEYDANGKKIYHKQEIKSLRISVETRHQYDDNGNMICVKGQTVFADPQDGPSGNRMCEWRHEYDGKGRRIHSKSSNGEEIEYDDGGNEICRRYSDGTIYRTEYTFWKNGKVKTKTEYVYHPKD